MIHFCAETVWLATVDRCSNPRQLICRHDVFLNLTTTNALTLFPDRIRNYTIDGVLYPNDVFTVDLTLQEIKTLRVRQQLAFRDQSYNGLFQVGVPPVLVIFPLSSEVLLQKAYW